MTLLLFSLPLYFTQYLYIYVKIIYIRLVAETTHEFRRFFLMQSFKIHIFMVKVNLYNFAKLIGKLSLYISVYSIH